MEEYNLIPEESRGTRALYAVIFTLCVLSVSILAIYDSVSSRHTMLSENKAGGLDWLQQQAKAEFESGEISFEEYISLMNNSNE